MSKQIAFISLGCAKNQVNCEQMMAAVQAAGFELRADPDGADLAVVNTCGFLASACEEAIGNILELAALKQAGRLKKILVTGCMAQRYKEDVLKEMPEVDGVLGTGSYEEIVQAARAVLEEGERPCCFGNIHTAAQGGARILSTPPWYAYLRIAEGCDNHCAYCVIPSLRGKYRSRPMGELLDEAAELASAGVKELLVIAQDITRYGTDFEEGKPLLAALLRELCKLDFHWIRLHYLYPDEVTEELVDTIAQEPKILPYLDIPIQHCNDGILKAMNRRDTKEGITALFRTLREKIPGLVLRTSLITGLPGEGPEEFEELCAFLREAKIERAGVFPFSPEEGTKAAQMEHVETEEAQRRAEIAVDVQSDVIDEYNESVLCTEREVLCEGFDGQAQMYFGRSYAESPDIDGRVYFIAETEPEPGEFVTVRFTGVMDGELTGERVE